VYEILSALTDDGLEPGALDESLSILLDIIVPDIFGTDSRVHGYSQCRFSFGYLGLHSAQRYGHYVLAEVF
jgi:hypothetical protein